MAVAPSCLTELPFSGPCAGADVPSSEGPAVARLVGRERGFGDRRRTEPRPESEWVGRDGDAAQRDDSFRSLRHGQVPWDDFADSVPEHMAGFRGDFDRRDHQEFAARRLLGRGDAADGIVIRNRDPHQPNLPRELHERRRIHAGIWGVACVVVEVEEHGVGRTGDPSLKGLRPGIPGERLCSPAPMSRT